MQARLLNYYLTIHIEPATGFSGWGMRRKRQFAQRADTIRINKANRVSHLTNSFGPFSGVFIKRIKEVRCLAMAEGVFSPGDNSLHACKCFVEEMFANGGKGNIV